MCPSVLCRPIMCVIKLLLLYWSVTAQWRGVLASGGAEDMSRLLTNVFDNYSTSVWPRINTSSPIEVKVGLGVMAVVTLDTRSQVLNLRGYVKVAWTDVRLHWEPADYGNITYIILSQDKVWRPDITMENSLLENIYVGREETRLSLDHRGVISWQPVFHSYFKCEVDVAKYPMDVNTCSVIINTWMHDNTCVKLSVMERHTTFEADVVNGQFNIEIDQPFSTVTNYDGMDYDFLHFRIKLIRRPAYTFISLLLPMFVIGLLNIVSFLIPSDNTEKVSLSLNILLATAVFIGVVHDDLPDRSDEISSVAVYVISLLVLAFFGVFGNTLVLLLHQHDEAHGSDHPGNGDTVIPANDSNGISLVETKSFSGSQSSQQFQQPIRSISFEGGHVTTSAKIKLFSQSERRTRDNNAHVCIRASPTRAARLNCAFLAVSTFTLIMCSALVLALILY